MLEIIRNFFDANLITEPESNEPDLIETSAAALMIEVMRADNEQTEEERAAILEVLQKELSVDPSTIEQLIALSHKEVDEATSLYQFTHLINQHYNPRQKFQLLVSLWRVAYADGHIDKYEDGIIRRIAELIHLHHREFIRAKYVARG